MFNLNGKVALITGAGQGIGAETARILAANGAHVVATDIDEVKVRATADQISGGEVSALGLQHDVTSADAWRRVIETTQNTFGRLDVLVNNAGIMLTKPFLQTSVEEFQATQKINVESIFVGIQIAYPLMAKTHEQFNSSPSVINISSVFGQVVGRWHSAYCASKGAVRLMTKAIGVELARMNSGIRVNSVHPGPTDTTLGNSGIEAAVSFGAIGSVEEGKKAFWASIPMGRIGTPTDIGKVIAFLASDASTYMTGAELTVDGGYALL